MMVYKQYKKLLENPSVYICSCNKKQEIQSVYSGEFSSCICGACFVDQTEHYIRVGGNPTLKDGMRKPH